MTRPKLLLADDSVTIRKVVELTFAEEGIEVFTVADADSAMSRFVEIQPDIVLVDVGLPGTSGYQICEMIKQDEATRHIPVLLLVGSFEPFDQDAAERACSDGFLTKPFHSIRDLVARVWDLLGGAPSVEPATVETSDIENLYQSSFAETVAIEEFDTVDDLLGDTGMDDEMIEASYPATEVPDNLIEFAPAIESGETATSKAFDWSPESLVSEPESPRPIVANTFEPKFVFDDSDETETRAGDGLETSDDEPKSEAEPSHVDMPTDEMAVLATFDETPADEVTMPASYDAPPMDEIAVPPVYDETSPAESLAPPVNDAGTAEPSPEFISLVAQRVIEKLSDRVIREIAQDAVPRIAEKLIREALEDEKKD